MHDIFLREESVRSRGGSAKKRAPHVGMASRFRAWQEGRRGELVAGWAKARAHAWREADARRVRLGEERTERERRRQKMELARYMLGDGEVSRGVRTALSEGAAEDTTHVREQLRFKHPRRGAVVRESSEGVAVDHIKIALDEALQDLPKGAAAGPNGMRNEYLRVLTKPFSGDHAKEVMGRLGAFAGLIARGELPDWFYLLVSSTKLTPIIKSHDPGAIGPEVRPVQVGDPLITTIWKVLMGGV